jgi:hypothetical protein
MSHGFDRAVGSRAARAIIVITATAQRRRCLERPRNGAGVLSLTCSRRPAATIVGMCELRPELPILVLVTQDD